MPSVRPDAGYSLRDIVGVIAHFFEAGQHIDENQAGVDITDAFIKPADMVPPHLEP